MVMRLPGSDYITKKTGTPNGECRILSASGTAYGPAELAACLLPQAPPKRTGVPLARQARGVDEINRAEAELR